MLSHLPKVLQVLLVAANPVSWMAINPSQQYLYVELQWKDNTEQDVIGNRKGASRQRQQTQTYVTKISVMPRKRPTNADYQSMYQVTSGANNGHVLTSDCNWLEKFIEGTWLRIKLLNHIKSTYNQLSYYGKFTWTFRNRKSAPIYMSKKIYIKLMALTPLLSMPLTLNNRRQIHLWQDPGIPLVSPPEGQ